MNQVIYLAFAVAALFGFWKLTRYFWLKRYYRLQGVKDVEVTIARLLHESAGLPIIDVREQSEYDDAHIQGVPLIPLGSLEARAAELQQFKDQELLIICRGGVRSAKACLILEKLGFSKPLNIAGGMNDWKRHGLPYVPGSASA